MAGNDSDSAPLAFFNSRSIFGTITSCCFPSASKPSRITEGIFPVPLASLQSPTSDKGNTALFEDMEKSRGFAPHSGAQTKGRAAGRNL